MFMVNNEGDLTDEENIEKEEANLVSVLFGQGVDKKEKKKLDKAASVIQKNWIERKT